jgi:hypothetical protein
MADNDQKVDPVGEQYFRPLRTAEFTVDVLFYVSAVFSFLAIFVEKNTHSIWYPVVQTVFVLSVMAFFVGNLAIRLYFSPRAQRRRYDDFLSHAYGIQLSYQQTENYYNNSATTVPARIASQVLENSFYSKNTASSMATVERIKVIPYLLLWFIVALTRSADLSIVAVAAQFVFSEQIVSRWLRLEWLRLRCESIFDELFQLLKSGSNLELPAVRLLGAYEIVKATAGIMLSTRLFERNQEQTDREWAQIRTTLSI